MLDLPLHPPPVGVVHLELMSDRSHLLGAGIPLLLLPSDRSSREAEGLLLAASPGRGGGLGSSIGPSAPPLPPPPRSHHDGDLRSGSGAEALGIGGHGVTASGGGGIGVGGHPHSPSSAITSPLSRFLMDLTCWLEAAFVAAARSGSGSGHLTLDLDMDLCSSLLRHCMEMGLPGCTEAVLDSALILGLRSEELPLDATQGSAGGINFVPEGGGGLGRGGGPSGSIMGARLADRLLHSSAGCHLPGEARALMSLNSGSTFDSTLTAPSARTAGGLSALHLAMRRGHPAIVEALISWSLCSGVRLNWSLPGPSGLCPLHLAAMLPHGESVIQALLNTPLPSG